ncbi:hypothetical protein [Alcanivorax sp. 1008]|uniref:hypothetical protein n=1 Tax=Alcanivorax sp. 1008 TaxID=2816853 RepID=UPI001E0CC0A3|nr:hypothetical protein [Alcanivorax sp. 1008]MCC1498009.1 hypothetical protein [Alcanivorax sp. 1008]
MRIWLESLLEEFELTAADLDRALSDGQESSRQVHKWLSGSNCVTARKVKEIGCLFPGSDEVFNLPLFPLLENKPITAPALRRHMRGLINAQDPLDFWQLPCELAGCSDGFGLRPIFENDVDMLYQHGGVYSFLAILYVLRRAEAERDNDLHLYASIYSYKSFPSLARHHHFRRHWEDLLRALERVQARCMTTAMLLRPDKAILREQIEAEDFITFREAQPRDVVSRRFLENKDPFIMASF